MVAVVKSIKSAGRDYVSDVKSGFDAGSRFHFADDDEAYVAELGGKGLIGQAISLTAYGIGSFVGNLSCGILPYMKMYGLPADVRNVEIESDLEAEVADGEVSGRDSRMGVVRVEEEAYGCERIFEARKKREGGYEVEEGDAEDSDYIRVSIDDDGDIYRDGNFVANIKEYLTPEGKRLNSRELKGRRLESKRLNSRELKGRRLENRVAGVNAGVEDGTFYNTVGDAAEALKEFEARTGRSLDPELLQTLGGIIQNGGGGKPIEEMSLEDIRKYEAEVVDEIAREYEAAVATNEARFEGRKYIMKGMEMATKLLTGDVDGGPVSKDIDKESRFYDAEKGAHLWNRIYRKSAESIIYDVANVNFDFNYDTDFSHEWKEFDWSIAPRIRGQRKALDIKMNHLESKEFKLDDVRRIVGNGYVSTLGVPVLYGENDANLPSRKRSFTSDEVKSLVNKIMT